MASSFNSVTLVGYLGRDPEMRYLPSGTPVTTFSIATSDRWSDKDGTPQERTTWFRVQAFSHLAETCQQLLHRGAYCYVHGSLSQKEYRDREGLARTSLEVRAREMWLLDKREEGQTTAAAGTPASEPADLTDLDQVPF